MKVSEILALVRYTACDIVTEYRDGECTGFKTLSVFDGGHTWTNSDLLSSKVVYFFSDKNRLKVVIKGEVAVENKGDEGNSKSDFCRGFDFGFYWGRVFRSFTEFLGRIHETSENDIREVD